MASLEFKTGVGTQICVTVPHTWGIQPLLPSPSHKKVQVGTSPEVPFTAYAAAIKLWQCCGGQAGRMMSRLLGHRRDGIKRGPHL